jgi:HK97 family phage portal protein
MLDYLTQFSGRFRQFAGRIFGFSLEDLDERMTASKSIKYAPVWYCTNKISGDVGKLPMVVNRLGEREVTPDTSHPAYRLVGYRPNVYQTAFHWKQQGMGHALLWGNWRSAIIRDAAGRPKELIPLLPDRSDTGLVDGEKWHLTIIDRDDHLSLYNDMILHPEKVIAIPDADVFHVPGFGFDGVQGKSVFATAAESFGTGLAAEKQVFSLAKKGFSGSLILEAPPGMFRDEADAKKFLDFFRNAHDGEDNAGKTAMLREGIKANMVAMNGRDSQWLEQRKFQRQDVMLWFGLGSIPGDGDSQGYNSLEEHNLEYLTSCLDNWLTKIEQEAWTKLLTERQKERYTHAFTFDRSALLKADMSKTADFATKMVMGRIMSPNEIRVKYLAMNPYAGGDTYDNPAIDPRSDTEQVPGDNEPVGPSNRRVISERVQHLIGVEAKRVNGYAANPNKFIGSIDRFYGSWRDTLGDVVEELGGDRAIAADYCKESHETLLELSGTVGPGDLAGAVAELVATWTGRAEALVEAVCNG